MTAITPELRQAIEDAGGVPPLIVDPQTNASYVLLRAEVYESIRTLLESDDGLEPGAMSPLIWNVMRGDWDDPKMDDYDHYPEGR